MGAWLNPQVLYAGFAGVVLLVIVYGNESDGEVQGYILDVISSPCDLKTLRALDRVAYKPLTILGLERVMLRILPHSDTHAPLQWSGDRRRSALSLCVASDPNAKVRMEWTRNLDFHWPSRLCEQLGDLHIASVAFAHQSRSAFRQKRIDNEAFLRLSSMEFSVGRFSPPFTLDSIWMQVHATVGRFESKQIHVPVLLPDMTGIVDTERPPLSHNTIAASAIQYAVSLQTAALRDALENVLFRSPSHLACKSFAHDRNSSVDALLILAKLGLYASDVGRHVIECVLGP